MRRRISNVAAFTICVLMAALLFPLLVVIVGVFLILSPLILLAEIMSWRDRLRLQRQQRQNGFCLACGYDLQASTSRCPECGVPIRPRFYRPTGAAWPASAMP